jgi:hypothetical protein
MTAPRTIYSYTYISESPAVATIPALPCSTLAPLKVRPRPTLPNVVQIRINTGVAPYLCFENTTKTYGEPPRTFHVILPPTIIVINDIRTK